MRHSRSFPALLLALVLAGCGDDGSNGTYDGGGAGGSGGGAPTCADTCVGVMAAACANGPPNTAECVAGCEDMKTGACATEYAGLEACAGSNPSFTCNASGFVSHATCSAQFDALYACLAASP